MANITIEYMILVPLMILLIFVLPYAASPIMNYWSTSSQTIALQDTSSHLESSIQQVYLFLNGQSIPSGQVISSAGIPQYISTFAYVGNATLTSVSATESVLNLTLHYIGNPKHVSVDSLVTLGGNAQLNATYSSFVSNSTATCINAIKDNTGKITLSFHT